MPHALPPSAAARIARSARFRAAIVPRLRLAASLAVVALLAACASSNFDKRISCVGGEAYFATKLGPLAMIERVPDADSLCVRAALAPAASASAVAR